MQRRGFLRRAATLAAAPASTLAFPAILSARERKPRLRVLGTHVTLQEPIRQQAERDLGIEIEFRPGGSAEVLLNAATDPETFDIYEQWSNSIKLLWQAGTIQAVDARRIERWDEVNGLSKTGRLLPDAPIGAGDAPFRLLYVQRNNTLGSTPTDALSFLPYVHNTDSFGYDTRHVREGIPYETESWGWLLDPAHRGKVAIINAPTIGLFDLVLAAQARGLIDFADLGNPSREELDALFDAIVAMKREGHFRGFWSSVPQSVRLMSRAEVHVQSMFSPAATLLRGAGIPCVFAAPREGYRAWHGVMCLSSACQGEALDIAYAFMNWWLSGWPGAFIARQGYYIANPQRSRAFMSAAEWDYWYAGKPAAEPLANTEGVTAVREGELRTGGSYEQRFSHVAVWNSVIDSYEHSLLRWKEFLLA